jgi:bifunctional non-homologous end joining protein LigD
MDQQRFNFWGMQQGWPNDTASHVFLARAVDAIGKSLFPQEWNGREPAAEKKRPLPESKIANGTDWIHEIKHDGYRLIFQSEGKRVRLFTRNGHDWSDRFPLIVEAALRNRISSFVIDGEAVLLGVDGRSDFNGLHSRKHNDEVQFYAFDVLAMQGEDLRELPLHLRKNNLSGLLARRVDGIFLSDFEQGDIGSDLFRTPV